jgi:ribosomal protein L29
MNPKLVDTRKLSNEELAVRELQLRESMFRLNFKKVLGDIETVGQIRKNKKELARVKTLLSARALGIEKQA